MRTIIVGTAGHIDHGKSSLVKALTGTDPDRLKEEKARGITIELGFAHASVAPDVTVSFVDVPGHERFVRTMLAGIGGIDAVLLVVAADESVMPQTREHFDICRLLRIPRGILVVTKVDAVDADTLELVTLEVRELVAGSPLADAPLVPVSSVTGAGLDVLRAELAALAVAVPPRASTGHARLPVDRAFSLRGFGTVVTGTLVGGRVAPDSELELLPEGRLVKVRGLHVHGQLRASAAAGERVAVNLANLDVADIPRGSVLSEPGALTGTRRIDAELTLLPAANALKHGTRVRLHHGTAEVLGRVSMAGAEGLIPAGGSALARLRLEMPAVVTRGDRLILRAYSPPVTIGGAVVLDPDPPKAGLRTAKGALRAERLRLRAAPEDDLTCALREMTATAGAAGVQARALVQRTGATAVAVADALARLDADGVIVVSHGWAVEPTVLASASHTMRQGLDAFHRQHPLAAGLPRDEARGRWFPAVPPPIFDRVLQDLAAQGVLVARDTVALTAHRVELSPEEATLLARLVARFADAGLAPPDVSALGAELARPQAAVDRIVQLLVKQRRLVRVETLVFDTDALERLKAEITALKASRPTERVTLDVKAFKDSYGVTRKFAIPLLEYLDRERVTRRMGDVRVVL